MMEFGEFVKKHRVEKGLTITALAEKAGISRPYLSQIEGGINKPPSEPKMRRLAEVLGIPFVVMWSVANQENLSEEYFEETLDYNHLNAKLDDIKSILKFISSKQMELSDRHNINQLFGKIESISDKLDELAIIRAPKKYQPTIENLIFNIMAIGSQGQGYIKKQIEVYRELFMEVSS